VLIVEAERFAGCGDDVVRSRSVSGRESIRRKPPKIVGWVARSKTQHQHTNTPEILGVILQPNLSMLLDAVNLFNILIVHALTSSSSAPYGLVFSTPL
jgi:hypothetical protein